MHGAALGAELEVRKVIVPPLSGVFSAWGMCMTAPRADVVRTHILSAGGGHRRRGRRRSSPSSREAARDARARRHATRRRGRLHPRGGRALPRPGAHGARARGRPGRSRRRRSRPTSTSSTGARTRSTWRATPPVELVTFHVSAYGRAPREAALPAPVGRRRLDARAQAPARRRLRPRRHARDRRLRARRPPDRLLAPGPLVIEEPTTTTLVHPGQTLEVDDFGNLVIWLR